jgi:hypothetical protein
MPHIKKSPICHPDRKYKAKGMCFSCYDKYLYHKDIEKSREKVKAKSKKYTSEHRELVNYNNKLCKEKDPIRYAFNALKARAKSINVEFSITIEYLKSIWKNICPIYGYELKFNNKRANNSYSVDRIDNSKGYIIGNLHIISWRANVLKNNATIEELEKIANFYTNLMGKK